MKKIYLFLVFAMTFLAKTTNANITVTLSGLNPPPQQIVAGAQDVSVMLFYMSRQGADSVVTSLTFQRLGFSDDNTAELFLYNQGIFIARGFFSGGQITFSGLHISLKTINAAIDVRVNVNATTTSSTFGVGLVKLSSLLTTNQTVNLNANIHFISISPVVFSGNVYPNGWQVNGNNGGWPQMIWGDQLSISTTTIGYDTLTFNLSGSFPVSALSNPRLSIGFYSFVGAIQGTKLTFVIDNTTGITWQPGLYNVNIEANVTPCATGTLLVSLNSQNDAKYHIASTPWQLYTTSGTYPLTSNLTFLPCYQYFIEKQNVGTNAYHAKVQLQNVGYRASDPTPMAYLSLWDYYNNNFTDSTLLHWNGSQYEGVVHFISLDADNNYNWTIDAVIDGVHYPMWQTNQGSFWFKTKECYLAHPGVTTADSITTNTAIISAKIQYPHPANGSEWYSTLYVLNEDKKDAYPSADTSIIFGSEWQTPQAVTDTARGSYYVKNLDSCTNYSYWFEWRQPCGGIIKSEVGHFRTKGSCHTDEKQLFIFPNPTLSYITVRFDYGRDADTDIGIYDMTGRLVQKETVQNSQQRIDVSSLPSGVYLIKGFRKNGKYTDPVTGKFVKVK